MEALGHFSLRKYSDAIDTAKLVVEGTSEDKDLATYILGQIYHAQRNPENALVYYKKTSKKQINRKRKGTADTRKCTQIRNFG